MVDVTNVADRRRGYYPIVSQSTTITPSPPNRSELEAWDTPTVTMRTLTSVPNWTLMVTRTAMMEM